MSESSATATRVRISGGRGAPIERALWPTPYEAELIAELGEACWAWHCDHVRGLSCQRIQCDELWAFCYAKEKNVPPEKRKQFGYGDTWTWTALDADTKGVERAELSHHQHQGGRVTPEAGAGELGPARVRQLPSVLPG